MECYDCIEEDLNRVVESSRTTREGLIYFTTTFTTLIPKINNMSIFENFRPISVYLCIHTIISKIIAKRLNRILSWKISTKQFKFLEGITFYYCKKIKSHGSKSGSIQSVGQCEIDLYEANPYSSWFLSSFCCLDNELYQL